LCQHPGGQRASGLSSGSLGVKAQHSPAGVGGQTAHSARAKAWSVLGAAESEGNMEADTLSTKG